MPIQLIAFLQDLPPKQGVNPKTNVRDLLEELGRALLTGLYRHPPDLLPTRRSPYFSDSYERMIQNVAEKNKREGLLACMAITAISDKLTLPKEKAGDGVLLPVWKQLQQEIPDKAARYFYFIQRQVRFTELGGYGNCAMRCCFAAPKLFEVLNDQKNCKIFIRSFGQYDQFYISIKSGGVRYIYDPLTNPEIIFHPKEYQEMILHKHFAERKKPLEDFQLEMTKEVINALKKYGPKTTELFRKNYAQAITEHQPREDVHVQMSLENYYAFCKEYGTTPEELIPSAEIRAHMDKMIQRRADINQEKLISIPAFQTDLTLRNILIPSPSWNQVLAFIMACASKSNPIPDSLAVRARDAAGDAEKAPKEPEEEQFQYGPRR